MAGAITNDNNGGPNKAASGALLWEGIALIAIGTFAFLVPCIFTLAVTTLVGVVFLLGGAVRLWHSLTTPGDGNRIWNILAGALAVIAGLLLLFNPVKGVLTLTIVVIALFFAEGATKLVAAFRLRPAAGWFWMLVSGAVDIVLAFVLWSGLPGTATWAIGLLVGISLLFTGWTAVAISLGMRRMGTART